MYEWRETCIPAYRALSSRLFQGKGEYETVRGPSSGRRGDPSPGMGVRGCHPRENFEIWDAIWCNLVHFGKKFTFLQLSTFVNENIVILLDSGIDTVTYYFNFLVVWTPSVSCCSRKLACSGRVMQLSSKQVVPWRGELMVLLQGE